jgi:hypothetical protein
MISTSKPPASLEGKVTHLKTGSRHLLPLLLLATFVLLTGCGAAAPSAATAAPTEVPTEAPADYKTAYLDALGTLVCTYGKYEIDSETGMVNGLKFGELIDFESDDVPEMLCICDRTAYIYGFEDGAAAELLAVPIGSAYGHTDVSNCIHTNEADGKIYVIVDDTDDEWTEDRWTAYTIEDGAAVWKDFFAQTDGSNEIPDDASLRCFSIDNVEVTSDKYFAQKSLYRDGSRVIDAVWPDDFASSEKLNTFLASLSAG